MNVFDPLLLALRASAEETRLRLLALCARADLTVSDLTRLLGQSQPRISRHLKVLVDAGLLDRSPEGSWVFYRLSAHPVTAAVLPLLPTHDPALARDVTRLHALQAERAEEANRYFSQNAGQWDQIRSLHVDDTVVEQAITTQLCQGRSGLGDVLDVGTGTGRMLTLLGPHAVSAIGVDTSRDMLALARDTLTRHDLRHCAVKAADFYALPWPSASFDSVIIHQVLHFAESPPAALSEAARVLRPGGRVLVVDFAPHSLESLRLNHAHRRLGFSDAEMNGWFAAAGLTALPSQALPEVPLTVMLWPAERLL